MFQMNVTDDGKAVIASAEGKNRFILFSMQSYEIVTDCLQNFLGQNMRK
jgi:hypothetical protein